MLFGQLVQVQHTNLEAIVLSLQHSHAPTDFLQGLLKTRFDFKELVIAVFEHPHLLILVGEYGLVAGLVRGQD